MHCQLHVHFSSIILQIAFGIGFGPSTWSCKPMQWISSCHAHEFDHTCLASPSINRGIIPLNFHPWINLKCCWIENQTSHQRNYFIFIQISQIWNSTKSGWISRSKVPRPLSHNPLKFCLAKGSKEASSDHHNSKVLFNWFFLRNSLFFDLFAWLLCCLKSSP